MSTQELVLREQLTVLYTDNHSWLQGWLNKKLNCSHRAADLLHDTFVQLLSRKELIKIREPKAYLMTITKRVLIDHWRRESVEQAYLDVLLQVPEEHAPSPEEQHMLLESIIEVDRLLNGLPIIVKRTFLYAQLDGLKQAEIATKLHISISSVKRYLVQAGVKCYFSLKFEP